MQQPGGDFLAGTRRPRDQQAAAGVGDALQRGTHLVDQRAVAGEFIGCGKALAQLGVLAAQLFGLGRAGNEVEQLFGLEGLLDEIDRAVPDGRDGGIDVAMA